MSIDEQLDRCEEHVRAIREDLKLARASADHLSLSLEEDALARARAREVEQLASLKEKRRG